MLIDIVLRYGGDWERANPPGRVAPIPENAEDFLGKNFFSDSNNEKLNLPTLAWASSDDNVVNFELNTKTLINLSNPPANLGAFGVDFGDHCGFDTAYGYTPTTSVLQSFVINNSPKFKSKAKFITTELTNTIPMPDKNEVHLRQWWLAKEDSPYLTLSFETFDPNQRYSCRFKKPYKSGRECHKLYTQSVPIELFRSLGLTVSKNSTESQILMRTLNGMIRVTNSSLPIDGTNFLPTHLMWRDF
jgi:hypothetical protein